MIAWWIFLNGTILISGFLTQICFIGPKELLLLNGLYFFGIVVAQRQVIPEGISTVNGSSTDMGCTGREQDGSYTLCNCSYLIDGVSPDIDTSSSNWASQLVTVRRSESNSVIHSPHVLLKFGFDTPVSVSMSVIEIDLFNCPDLNIGATSIQAYFKVEYDLSLDISSVSFAPFVPLSQSSCNSLSTVTISLLPEQDSFQTIYIVVTLDSSSIEWVHVGEVRFNEIIPSCHLPTTSTSPMMQIESIASTVIQETSSNHTKSQHHLVNTSIVTLQTEKEKNNGLSSMLTVLLTIALLMFLSILIVITILIVILCRVRVRGKQKLNDLSKSHNDDTRNRNDPSTIELSNPTYARHRTELQQPSTSTGSYSVINIDNINSTTKKDETQQGASGGQEFIGMYAVAGPVTHSAKNKGEIVDSAAYARINPTVYASANELDKVQKPSTETLKSEVQAQGVEAGYATVSGGRVGAEDVRSRMYSDLQVREIPSVPTKSSDLLEELDDEAELNVGVYSESINPLDFTRNRKKGHKNDLQILGPIFPVLPESYTSDELEVSDKNITETTQQGIGQFGEVVLAETNGLSLKSMGLSKTDKDQSVSVKAVLKKLQPNSSPAQIEIFDKEAELISHTRHPNVVRLLGVCRQDPAFIMLEYPDEGDLTQFLKQYSEIVTTSSSQTQITTSELIYIASQIASGMKYLASFCFVHRDLAVRSCYVAANNSIKLGDMGVNTSLYQSSYYRIRGNRIVPIRWMAPECFSGKFSEKSDVWAFGVTMWELFTLAKDLPYPHLSDEEVVHNALKREYRQFPPRPPACPLSVYGMMEQCWEVDMRHRPTFQKLLQFLEKE